MSLITLRGRHARSARVRSRAVPPEPVAPSGVFSRATYEALDGVVPAAVARAVVDRALRAADVGSVPEDVGSFRWFAEGPLRSELGRILGEDEIARVFERLGDVLWMATSDVRALGVARTWARRSTPTEIPSSGTHARIPSDPVSDRDSGVAAKRPTIPAPSSPPAQVPAPRPRSPVPPAALGLSLRSPRMPAAPTAVLVVSLDPELAAATQQELGGRCPVLTIASPSDLARATTRAGDRVVVLVDTMLPSIEVPTFVGLAPILPPGTRVVLWGADERQLARLTTQHAVARDWLGSGEASSPGAFVLALACG